MLSACWIESGRGARKLITFMSGRCYILSTRNTTDDHYSRDGSNGFSDLPGALQGQADHKIWQTGSDRGLFLTAASTIFPSPTSSLSWLGGRLEESAIHRSMEFPDWKGSISRREKRGKDLVVRLPFWIFCLSVPLYQDRVLGRMEQTGKTRIKKALLQHPGNALRN